MIDLGVNRGLYDLEDLAMGEEDINGRHFFTMKYKTVYGSSVTNNGLYLFFPQPENNDYFFAAVDAEVPISQNANTASCQADFQTLLSSLEHLSSPSQ